ncbi:MAG: ABC transporter ATP-binding protein, partial [Desulfuromusa sp.]|nr:ABC transporter ATP-binding protein [Desulfuromusa sp.]
ILERLVGLNRDGVTLIYTTHYMEEAQQICDEIAIIDAGKVIACGAPEKLVGDSTDCVNLEDLFLALTGKQLRD